MREFFRGWKRKAGCATLVMALALFGMWMRSHVLIEFYEISVRDRQHCFGSFHGCLSWRSWDTRINGRGETWISLPAKTISAETLLDLDKTTADSHTRQWVIPHAGVVIPLTLLAAYLLLSKQRPMKQTSRSEGNVSPAGSLESL